MGPKGSDTYPAQGEMVGGTGAGPIPGEARACPNDSDTHCGVRGLNPLLLCLVTNDGRQQCVGGVTRRPAMPRSKASQRRALVRRFKLWLHRPATFKVAVITLHVANLIARLISLIK